MWASNTNTATISCPIGSAGSAEPTVTGSARVRSPTPRPVSSWTKPRVSRVVRANRSKVCTTTTSPGPASSRTARHPGRSTDTPTKVSEKIRSTPTPAAVNASICRCKSRSTVDTRAYPNSTS